MILSFLLSVIMFQPLLSVNFDECHLSETCYVNVIVNQACWYYCLLGVINPL